ncbi:chromosome partitioning protein ParB [Solemya pervernicosa gill symbiont]|uniref:Probable chromosome-partitioning protein ParB n=2 Tax=Gammaproteobacteria incertae sedis TaxID=118884 RepID=A0A1T2L373_9GAMM|nr:ParB/RepB/Spo0J family partition protein [Candidatus Reidiella endopervernicosa]OOZ39386.1 chromosome partitioning protein ParB [Solemya pervernicosa gill symbiont]QKQ25330.1 ParB/RepB/Spo0J family partition protein [Candidatus Reidiella endopervernicosa]
MAAKKRGLGRGLDALLGASAKSAVEESDESKAGSDEGKGGEQLRNLPVELMQRGKYQPRMDMHPESLEELADSIRAQGVVQPIVVRPIGKDRYEIIAGERRWRASQIAGLSEIPVVIRDVPDEAAIAMALIENIQRENLNPIEEAVALKRLLDEFELTHQQAAEAVGRSRASVSNLLRLLDLNDDVRKLLEHGDLEMGHARCLLALKGAEQSQTARQVVAKGLSVRETEALVRRTQEAPKQKASSKALDPDIRNLQDSLSDKLGAVVKVQAGAKGKGKLVIQYNSLDELDGILEHIK